MATKKTSTSPLTVVPKRYSDRILHYLVLQRITKSKDPALSSSFGYHRHPHFIFQYHKNFQLMKRLKGNALALLQTQYAKKPRNPE